MWAHLSYAQCSRTKIPSEFHVHGFWASRSEPTKCYHVAWNSQADPTKCYHVALWLMSVWEAKQVVQKQGAGIDWDYVSSNIGHTNESQRRSMVATYCPGRMAEHSKSKSTGGFDQADVSPCTNVDLVQQERLAKSPSGFHLYGLYCY